MPVKQRAAKERIPQFGTEVLELFTRLENTPLRQRRAQWWKDGEKFLMCSLLDMGGEFWMMCSPLNREPERFCPPPHMCAHDAWHACRRLRIDLLEATGLAKESRAGKAVVDLRNGAGQS
ncbi:MAG: hypothetical protein WBZ51_28590 [Xanthobacteraceae bacterium]